MDTVILYLKKNNIDYKQHIELNKVTWIHRGGHCNLYIEPSNIDQLIKVCRFLYANKLKFYIFGHTSNIYILNDCNLDIVVSVKKCNSYSLDKNHLRVDCGVSVIKLSKAMIDIGVSGFEFLTALPGTVGAAIYNNSSCKDNSINSLLVYVELLTPSGELINIERNDLRLTYRSSILKRKELEGVIVSACLKVSFSEKQKLQQISIENERQRKLRLEPPAMNLGCTVNRPFSLGKMPILYMIPMRMISLLCKIFCVPNKIKTRILKNIILTISGYRELKRYVSDYLILTFVWRDSHADDVFDSYLSFMKKVYKTDKIEIEIFR